MLGLRPGYVYRFELSNLPYAPGKSLYPEVEVLCRHQFSTAEQRGTPSHILHEKQLPFIPHGGRKGDLEVPPRLKWEGKE